jgi:hypothetical protein
MRLARAAERERGGDDDEREARDQEREHEPRPTTAITIAVSSAERLARRTGSRAMSMADWIRHADRGGIQFGVRHRFLSRACPRRICDDLSTAAGQPIPARGTPCHTARRPFSPSPSSTFLASDTTDCTCLRKASSSPSNRRFTVAARSGGAASVGRHLRASRSLPTSAP